MGAAIFLFTFFHHKERD